MLPPIQLLSSSIAMDSVTDDFGGTAWFEVPSYSNTTNTTAHLDDSAVVDLDIWSPGVDWDALYGNNDDLRDLIGSMVKESDLTPPSMTSHEDHGEGHRDTIVIDDENDEGDDLMGLRLVHLLMAAAEAVSGGAASRDLARVILVRLKELASPSNGTNMERLAAYFSDGLQDLLDGTASEHGKRIGVNAGPHPLDNQLNNPTDALAAFQLLHDISPYVKFGHFTANQAILEAVAHEKRIHIVDYDIMEGVQWASFMQALVSKENGPPAQNLRITALSRGGIGRRSIGTVQETGRRLIAFAASIALPFSFHQCRLDSDEMFRPSVLKLVKGELLVFNCMLHVPHFGNQRFRSVTSFLSGAKLLNPKLVTLVEEEVGPMGPIGERGFVGQFMDLLHHYSAMFDSMETGFPMQTLTRALVERVFLRPRISRSLAQIYNGHEDKGCSWWEWLAAAGFGKVNISFATHCQAKLLLGLFHDGYRVEELANNRLVLGWKSRRLLSASVWTSSSENEL